VSPVALDGVADLGGRHRVGGEGTVQGETLDEGVDLARGRRVEMGLEGVAAALHPGLGDGAQPRDAGGGHVELDGEHQVVAGGEQVVGDQGDHRFDGLVAVAGGGEPLVEDGGDGVGVPGEGLGEDFVERREVVGHRPERHVRGLGDLPVGGSGDTAFGDDGQGGVDEPVAAVRVVPPGPYART
jgi:hypothetical protein